MHTYNDLGLGVISSDSEMFYLHSHLVSIDIAKTLYYQFKTI